MLDPVMAELIHVWETDHQFRTLFRTKPDEALQSYGIDLTREQRLALGLPPIAACGEGDAASLASAA